MPPESTTQTPAPTYSRIPTSVGEPLVLRRYLAEGDGRLSEPSECFVGVTVSTCGEVEAGRHHRVDVDRRRDDGTLGDRVCGVSVYDPLSDAERAALVASFSPPRDLVWAERRSTV
jgi:hypothetical protein